MSITSDFSKFKKIDAHSHIGTFGSPFNIHFNADLLLKQMEEFNIEKTILCSDGPHTNEETVAAFKAHPDKIIPLMWINCAEGKPAYDALEHYIRDEYFAVLDRVHGAGININIRIEFLHGYFVTSCF